MKAALALILVTLLAGCSTRESAERAWRSFGLACDRDSFEVRMSMDTERQYFVASCRVTK